VKKKTFISVLILICIQTSSWCADAPQTAISLEAAIPLKAEPIAISGLTDTVATLLAARPAVLTNIGTGRMSLEKMIIQDLPSAFKFDSAIQEYLDAQGENAGYDGLSRALEVRLRESIGPYASVEAAALEDDSLMQFSIAFSLMRLVLVPVDIVSKDGSLSATFTLPCHADLEFDADLFVDTKLVNEGNGQQGIALRINYFEITLTADPEKLEEASEGWASLPAGTDSIQESNKKITVSFDKKKYLTALTQAKLEARIYFQLSKPEKNDADTARFPAREDPQGYYKEETAADILTYQDLSAGNYRWEINAIDTQSFTLTETGKRPKSERERDAYELSYSFDSQTETSDQKRLSFSDGIDWLKFDVPLAENRE
jgi:hypothetical protein